MVSVTEMHRHFVWRICVMMSEKTTLTIITCICVYYIVGHIYKQNDEQKIKFVCRYHTRYLLNVYVSVTSSASAVADKHHSNFHLVIELDYPGAQPRLKS